MSDDFDETIDALSMSFNEPLLTESPPSIYSGSATHINFQDTPVQAPQIDILTQQIMDKINEYNYPITAQFIANKIGKTKSDVNSKLYKMKSNNQVEQLDCMPPLWRVII